MKGLYENWLAIELRDKTLAETLRLINAECGTLYKHNWPSRMAKSGYALERVPKPVRQYMMRVVLPELTARSYTDDELKILVDGLT